MRRARLGMGILGACLCVLLSACLSPQASGVKVIAEAKLETASGQPVIPYSVVVIENGKFTAVGPQRSTPVPPGAEMIRGAGMTIEPVPGGNPIEVGQPANLILKNDSGADSRTMRAGEWVK